MESSLKLRTDLKNDIMDNLNQLSKSFEKYYPVDEEIAKENWIRDPFAAKDLPTHLDIKEKSELIELITDPALQNFYMKEELADFCSVVNRLELLMTFLNRLDF